MRVGLYARVSTVDQNPESQLTELREFAQRRQFTVYREYVDRVTGVIEKRRRPEHTAYAALMEDAHARRFDCVVVWKFDRLARSLQSLLEALQTFSALGIDFVSATQQIDTTTPAGKLFFSIVGSFAEFERELIRDRTRAGLDNAKRKGVTLGRPRDTKIDGEILRLKAAGVGVREIGRRVGRSPAGINQILKRFTGEQADG